MIIIMYLYLHSIFLTEYSQILYLDFIWLHMGNNFSCVKSRTFISNHYIEANIVCFCNQDNLFILNSLHRLNTRTN